MPHRGICPRCGVHERWAPRFSEHLGECTEPFSVVYVHGMLGVIPGAVDECWEIPEMHSVPKIGTAPGEVEYGYVVVALATYGDHRGDQMVCHTCDNRACLNPAHLYWGTSATNTADAWRNGRRVMSSKQKQAMKAGRRNSEKARARQIEHNRTVAANNRGDQHWTHGSEEAMTRWKNAIRAGRQREEEVMPNARP